MKIKQTFLDDISKKESILANLFWGAFTLYSFAYAYTGTANPNFIRAQVAQLLSVAIMLPTLFLLANFNIKNSYLKVVYTCYCLWLLFIVISGYNDWTKFIKLKGFLFNPVVGLVYFAPLVMLIPLKVNMLKKFFTVIAVFGAGYIILDIIFIKYLITPNRTNTISQGIIENFADISFACGFLLFTYVYHKTRRNFIALIALLATLLFATIQARRGLIFMFSLMFLISYFIFVFNSKLKILILYFSLFIAIIAAFSLTNNYKIKSSNLFGYLLDRGSEDTRTGVEIYFYDDFKLQDWIIGRGIYGDYFAPNIEENQETNNRSLIETGYLHTILKGGLISLVLFLLIAIPAIFKGLFSSRNILSKASAIWIAMALLNSYPTIQNAYNINYLLVWICIGICYNKEVRNINDKELIQILNPNKPVQTHNYV